MKKYALLLLVFFLAVAAKASAQDQEIEQLILDVEKLSQFKQILQDMKTGYTVIMQGYNTVKDISQGDFNLHKTFLDGLLVISPAVRNYKKVADIIGFQLRLATQYKSAFSRFKSSSYFNPDELGYFAKVYDHLLDGSLKNLNDLATVLTAGQLRMSDAERLSTIDGIYRSMQDKLLFLRYFNNSNSLLAAQRANTAKELQTVQDFIHH